MLTNTQKNIIAKKYKQFSAKKIAKLIDAKKEDVELFIKSFPQNKTPKWFGFILIIFPLLLIIILEIGLRISDYGTDYARWINLDTKYEILNPEIAKKYFSNITNVPFSTESFLLREKPKDSFRIIALGASSGAGYPYQNAGSFTKYLRKSFQYAIPDKKIEVANISMAAINSYTILDLLPSVLKKKPDQIVIYLGHNEYYGALGVGSTNSFISSRTLTNFIIHFKEFKIYQLVENFLKSASSFLTNQTTSDGRTLMAKMAKEKEILFNSESYYSGLEQFEENLTDIFALCKSHNIPVIIGTLASNLKDLSPFTSVISDSMNSANHEFEKAHVEYKKNNLIKADSLFRFAKDLDGLRFRAPEEFNNIIKTLSSNFNFQVVDFDSAINANSIYGIVGNEFMIDHLHPNLEGYKILGKLYFNEIISQRFKEYESRINFESIDSFVNSNYHFTNYDSTISNYRVKILKNDWPFVNTTTTIDKRSLLNPKSKEEIIAYEVLEGKVSRVESRMRLIDYYFEKKEYNNFVEELLALVDMFPIEKHQLNKSCEKLITIGKYGYVERLLSTSYYISPDIYNTKWLGIMNFSNNKVDSALRYLTESYNIYRTDPQVLFNISGIYLQKNELKKAHKFILACINISPNYKNANNVKSRIDYLLKKK